LIVEVFGGLILWQCIRHQLVSKECLRLTESWKATINNSTPNSYNRSINQSSISRQSINQSTNQLLSTLSSSSSSTSSSTPTPPLPLHFLHRNHVPARIHHSLCDRLWPWHSRPRPSFRIRAVCLNEPATLIPSSSSSLSLSSPRSPFYLHPHFSPNEAFFAHPISISLPESADCRIVPCCI
jgi:hypothetical protein